MICRHCEHRTHTRLMSGDAFAFCPACGCPAGLPLNHPKVLSGEARAGDALPPPLTRYSSVTVALDGCVLDATDQVQDVVMHSVERALGEFGMRDSAAHARGRVRAARVALCGACCAR